MDVVSTATGTPGALWQISALGARLRELYEARPSWRMPGWTSNPDWSGS
jgi:hypothetical protein